MWIAWTVARARRMTRKLTPRSARLVLALTIATLQLWLGATGHADSYEQAWERVVRLEREGQLEAAIHELEPLVEAYPQDYGLVLQRAWLQYQVGDFAASEATYRRALELSGGSFEANLGLAWSLIHQGDLEAATELLDTLATRFPENTSIHEALAYADSPPPTARWSAWAAGSLQDYGYLPSVSWGRGLNLGAGGLFWGRLVVAASYRFTRFGWEPADDVDSESVEWSKHEVFLNLGLVFPSVSVVAAYGMLLSGLGDDGDAHILGLSTRFRLWGELRLDGALGVFDDDNVYQLTPSWSFAITESFRIRPCGMLQIIDEDLLWSGCLDLVVVGEPGEISFGAWTGEQERRIDLDISTVYDLGASMSYGGAIEGRLDFEKWSLSAGYELAAVAPDEGGSTLTELVHWFGLGVIIRLP